MLLWLLLCYGISSIVAYILFRLECAISGTRWTIGNRFISIFASLVPIAGFSAALTMFIVACGQIKNNKIKNYLDKTAKW